MFDAASSVIPQDAQAGHGPPPPTIHGFLDGLKIVFQSGKVRVAGGLAKLNDFGRCFPGSCHPLPRRTPLRRRSPAPAGSPRRLTAGASGGVIMPGPVAGTRGGFRCTGVARR